RLSAAHVREWSSTEPAGAERPPPRRSPAGAAATGVAAAGKSPSLAAGVTSRHGGPCRTVYQRDHEEGGEERYWQPTVPMSCGAGHAHTSEATRVPDA